jgi:FkbM family methyltransferase
MSNTAEVRLSAPHDLVTYSMVGPGDDAGVIGEIQHSGGTYEPQVMAALRRLLAPDAVVFDVGANIGVFALVMSRLVPRGRVFAFEPAPENFAYLLENVARNGADNVTTERSAVWDKAGTVPFVFSPESPSGSFVSTDGNHAAESSPVDAIRLDDYVTDRGLRRVDLIMVDAEGAEMAVLRGGAQTIVAHRPALLVEINPVSLRRFGGISFWDLVAVLRADRTLYSIASDGGLARIVADRHLSLLLRREGVIDLLALPGRHPATMAGGIAATAGAWARGLRELRELGRAYNARTPPENNFVVEPSFTLRPPLEAVRGLPGQNLELTVPIHNSSACWLSSDFVYHPIHVSYHWLSADGAPVEVEAHRGRFAVPLAPGATGTVRTPVKLPVIPGDYQLVFTLLQESFAWFDDLDPALRLTVPGTVTG